MLKVGGFLNTILAVNINIVFCMMSYNFCKFNCGLQPFTVFTHV